MLIIVATDDEYVIAQKRFKNCEIIKTGIGGLNVIERLQPLDRNVEILNFGHVGSNNLPIGSEVYVKYSKLYHPNVEYDEKTYRLQGELSNITCYTSNDFILNTNITEPCVFDMELAYIMALGFKNVTSLTIVSDNLSLHEYNNTVKKVKENK